MIKRIMTVFTMSAALMTMASLAHAETSDAEQVVNVYSARHYDTDAELLKRFTEQTGIKVNLISGKSDELLARIKREGRRCPADVLITVDAGRLHRAVEQGFLQPTKSEVLEKRIPESLRHPKGLWFGLTMRARVMAASNERVPHDAQINYEDLTTSAWHGRVLVRSSSNIYNQSLVASMIESRGLSAAEQWCKALVANFARRPQGGDRDQIRAVAAGEGDVAIVNHYYYARMLTGNKADREAASKVRLIFPNQSDRGTHINVSGAGIVRYAPNRANAVKFLEYLVTDDAQQAFAGGNQEYPVVKDVAIDPLLQKFGSFHADDINAVQLGEHNRKAVTIMDRAGWR